jgi:hypothetical protein
MIIKDAMPKGMSQKRKKREKNNGYKDTRQRE